MHTPRFSAGSYLVGGHVLSLHQGRVAPGREIALFYRIHFPNPLTEAFRMKRDRGPEGKK